MAVWAFNVSLLMEKYDRYVKANAGADAPATESFRKASAQKKLPSLIFTLVVTTTVTLGSIIFITYYTEWDVGRILSAINIVVAGFVIYRLLFIWSPPDTNPKMLSALAIGATVLLGMWVYVWPSWLSSNICGILSVGFVAALAGQIKKIRYVVVIFFAIMLYDLIGIFGTSFIIDMVYSTTGPDGSRELSLGPIFISPRNLFPLERPTSSNTLSILGYGDVIVASVVVVMARKYHLVLWVIAGFAVGLLAATLVGITFRHAMPATVFIIPATMSALFFGAWLQNRRLAF
jgi:presenilin-like A22 family membrane protease